MCSSSDHCGPLVSVMPHEQSISSRSPGRCRTSPTVTWEARASALARCMAALTGACSLTPHTLTAGARARARSRPLERLLDVLQEVGHVLQADGQPHD